MFADFVANVFADISNIGMHFIHPLTKHNHSCACLLCSAHDKDPNKQSRSSYATVAPLATPSDLDLLKTGSKSIRQLVILSAQNQNLIGDIPLQQFCMELKTHLNFTISFGLPKINPNTPYHVLVLVIYDEHDGDDSRTTSWFMRVIARHTKRAVVICPARRTPEFSQHQSSKSTILAYDSLAMTLRGLTHGMMVTKQCLMPKDLNRFLPTNSQTVASHIPQPGMCLFL